MYNLPEIDESLDSLDAQVRSEQDAQIQRRLQMLLLLKNGKVESRSAADDRLGVHRNTIANWLELYEAGGIDKLHSYTDEAVASLTGYQYLVDAASAQPS